MATWPTLYQRFLRVIRRSDTTDMKSDFAHFCNICSEDIQEFAGVEKVWSVTIVAGTQSYTLSGASITDLYKAREGRFLATGGTDELAEYTVWPVLPSYDDVGRVGFYIAASTIYVPIEPTEGGTLKIRGDKRLAAVSSSAFDDGGATEPEIDDAFHDIYIWHGAMMYGIQRQDFDGRMPVFQRNYERRKVDLMSFNDEHRHEVELLPTELRW